MAYLRENLPLSEGAAAYRAWITPQHWRAIENGKRLSSLAVFIMLARMLGLDPRELLEEFLERMHYGRGAPPILRPLLRKASTEAEPECPRLMAEDQGSCQAADAESELPKRRAPVHSR